MIVEIQDREKVLVHADVAATIDAMLLGEPVAPELRWRDDEGVHRSQSRPKPTARDADGDRFSGLTGGGAGAWGREPGWRGASTYRTGGYAGEDRVAARPGFRPGQTGGWRAGRGASDRGGDRGARSPEGDRPAPMSVMPGERFAVRPGTPFVAGEIADRGPLERAEGTVMGAPVPDVRARDARELQRQLAWRAEAARALDTLKVDEGTRPVNAAEIEAAEEARIALMVPGEVGSTFDDADDDAAPFGSGSLTVEDGTLPTLRVFPHGISRKRLEQAIRDLQLPVIIAREPDEADVAMTLRSEYRQKPPALRDVEDRGIPIYVLKANTVAQIQASLTSVFALEVDPREAALRETEQAIGLVLKQQEPVELAPQNAYIRRLQHQMAERANLVVAVPRPGAVPQGQAVPGRREARLALSRLAEPPDAGPADADPAAGRWARQSRTRMLSPGAGLPGSAYQGRLAHAASCHRDRDRLRRARRGGGLLGGSPGVRAACRQRAVRGPRPATTLRARPAAAPVPEGPRAKGGQEPRPSRLPGRRHGRRGRAVARPGCHLRGRALAGQPPLDRDDGSRRATSSASRATADWTGRP